MSQDPGTQPDVMDGAMLDPMYAATPRTRRRAGKLRWLVGGSSLAILAAVGLMVVSPMMATRAFGAAMQAAGKAKSMTCKARYVVEMTIMGMNQTVEMPLEMSFAQPNKVRMSAGKGGSLMTIVSDGKTAWMTMPMCKAVAKAPAPADMNSLRKQANASQAGAIDGLPTAEGLMSGFDPKDITSVKPGVHSNSEWIRSRPSPAGSKPFTVTTKEGYDAVIWVDVMRQMPRQIACDLSAEQMQKAMSTQMKDAPQLKAISGLLKDVTMRLTCTFDQLDINPTMAADAFTYKPAPGQKVVEAKTFEDAPKALTKEMMSSLGDPNMMKDFDPSKMFK